MIPSSGNSKKPTVCRYYAHNGSCIYGPDCKFLHSASGSISGDVCSSDMDKRFPADGQHMQYRQHGGDYTNGCAEMGDLQQFHYSPQRGAMMRTSSTQPQHYSPAFSDDRGISHGLAAMTFARPSNRSSVPFYPQISINPGASEFVPKAAPLPHGYSFPSMATDYLAQTRSLGMGFDGMAASYQTHPSPTMSPHGSPIAQRRSKSPVNTLDMTAVARGHSEEAATIQENVGGTTYFYKPDDFDSPHTHQAFPTYAMYSGMPTYVAHMKLKDGAQNSFFMPDELKMELLSKQMDVLSSVVDGSTAGIPEEVDTYRHLVPLESTAAKKHSNRLHYVTTCYKAVNVKDNLTYCLRRVHGFKLTNTKCMAVIDSWKKISHSNVVGFREVFTTKAFGDTSILFVYDYHPKATTLQHKHFSSTSSAVNGYPGGSARSFNAAAPTTASSQRPAAAAGGGSFLPESLLWSYIVQLSNALRAIHAAGLAYQAMDPSKILLTDKTRLRLNCVGIMDVISAQGSNANVQASSGGSSNPLALVPLQQEDLTAFGKIVLALACNSLTAVLPDQLKNSMEVVARTYSVDLHNLIMCMLGPTQRLHSINDIMPMIGARFYVQLDAAQSQSDVLEHELSKEVECGRLFRLLSKLGAVNERPEYAMDPAWSETGDRYMLKLYRDYLFHQVDERGAPQIDMSHMVSSLNKLDAGISEKVQLSSRDEQSVIIVTYAELKRCFETAFGELLQASRGCDDSMPKPPQPQ